MATSQTPAEYIQHHLTNLHVGEGFWAIEPRPDGRLWIASDRGLLLFDPGSGGRVLAEKSVVGVNTRRCRGVSRAQES